MHYKVVPLSAGFMLVSIIGGLISATYIYDFSKPFGFTFFLFFGCMFIASIISMSLAPIDAEFHVNEKNLRYRNKK